MYYFIEKVKLSNYSKHSLSPVLFWFSGFLLLCALSFKAQAKVSIVYTSNQPDILLKKQVAHFPELSTLLKRTRSENDNVLFLHGGDSFAPSAISLFDDAANIIALANMMDVSLYSASKRELSYDIDVLSLRSLEAQFPIVTRNILDNRNNQIVEGLFPSYEFDLDGIKIAVTSMINPRARITYAPALAEVIDLELLLPSVVQEQKHADLKIFMTDLKMAEVVQIAKDYDFDVIFSAQDGPDEVFEVAGTQIVYAGGQDGDAVVLEYDKTLDTPLTARVVDLSQYLPDPDVVDFISQYRMRLGKLFNEKIAVAADQFTTKKDIIRTRETALANVFVDALREDAKTDIAIINSGSIRNSEIYPQGYYFTREDIQQEFPFGDYFVVVNMSGREISAMMENSVSRIEYQDGRFLNISGFKAVYDSSKPAGSRIDSIYIDGKLIDQNKTYTMAMQGFFLKGADEYAMLKNKEPLNDLLYKRKIWHIVTDYFIKRKSIAKPELDRLIDKGLNED